MPKRFMLPLLIALSSLVSGCAYFRAAEKGVASTLFTAQQEAAIGNQYHEQIIQEYQVLDDPEAEAWLREVGAKLVENSPPCPQEFQFFVTDSPEVNAFAIPGGYCYLNVGLIDYADNEAQVIAVLGHEINHVTQRHGILSMQRALGIDLATDLALEQVSDTTAQAAEIVGQAGGFLVTRKFGRDDEREADRYGVEAMYEAGWDPREAITFFEKLRDLSGGAQSSTFQNIMSTHPPTTERINNITEQVSRYNLESKELRVDSPRFEAIKARLTGK